MMSGIGIPSKHVNNLKNGIYRTHLKLKETVKRSAAVRLNLEMISVFPDIYKHSRYEDEDEEDNDKVKNNHLTSQDISEQEVSVMSLTDNSIEKVEKQLTEVCEDIFSSLEKRFKPTSLVKASVEAFHRTEWAENISKDMLETSARVNLEELVKKSYRRQTSGEV